MRGRFGAAALGAAALLWVGAVVAATTRPAPPVGDARSAQLFERMMPVFGSPRCLNCHTATDFPRQGDDRHRHQMFVVRGQDDHGAPSLRCQACHQRRNGAASGIPGVADWHLAPLRMAWEGLTAGELCRLILDPRRGRQAPATLLDHMRTPLVQWAWNPGTRENGVARATPPMSDVAFQRLVADWVASGARCPAADTGPRLPTGEVR